MLIEENFKEKGCVHLARAPNLHARPEHSLSKSFCASCKERAFNTSPQKWLSLKLLVLIMCMAAMGLSGLRRWKASLASNVFNLDPPSDMWGKTTTDWQTKLYLYLRATHCNYYCAFKCLLLSLLKFPRSWRSTVKHLKHKMSLVLMK